MFDTPPCKFCFAHLLNHKTLANWKQCPNCSYAHEKGNYMITANELNPHGYPTPAPIDANLAILLDRVNKLRAAYAKPMIVTSGLRSEADQQRINPKAPHSKHLEGAACDFQDGDGKLKEWVKANVPLMEQIGLWMEDFAHTPNWLHVQIIAPKSGNRFFIP